MRHSLLLMSVCVLILSGCFRTRSDIAREKEEDQQILQESAQQAQRLDNLESQLGKFQGQIEELQHQRRQELKDVQNAVEKQGKRTEEMDEKISAISSRMDLLFEELKQLKEDGLAAAAQKSEPSAKKKSAVGNVSEGVAAFKKKDFASAAGHFEAYLEKYPKGKRALEASYYLGEARFQEKDYARAILAYSTVHEKSPKSSLGRKATLKIAESFSSLGKKAEAKSFAQLLVQASPGSAEAKKARKFLK